MGNRYVVDLTEVGSGDTGLVGGKNASLGEMLGALGEAGIRVPEGFATTADAYWAFLDANQLRERIGERLERLRAGEAELAEVGAVDPPDDPRGRVPGRAARVDRRGLRRPRGAARGRGARRRGALQRHRRGPARGQLRRPAGDLPQRHRGRDAARRVPALHRLAVHRPRDHLPREQRLRPHEGGALGRRAADGALRPGWRRDDVLDRHRDRLPPHGDHRRQLGAGRGGGQRHGRPGLLRRLQAAARPARTWRRSSRGSAAARR